MIEQIVIERCAKVWCWDVYSEEAERPLASGTAPTLEGAMDDLERYIRESEE